MNDIRYRKSTDWNWPEWVSEFVAVGIFFVMAYFVAVIVLSIGGY